MEEQSARQRREEVVTIEKLTYGGDGLARLPEGKVIFVPYTLPGESVRLSVESEKRSFARGQVLSVLKPSEHRRPARCKHFGECGGCQFQHIDYAEQLRLKRETLVEELRAVRGLERPPVEDTVPSPKAWNYRNKLEFRLTPDGRLAYLSRGGRRLVPIEECFLPEDALAATWPQLEFEPDLPLERVTLRQGTNDDVLLLLEGEEEDAPEFSVDFPISAVYQGPSKQVLLADTDSVILDVLGRPFKVSAASFFQVNTEQISAMVEYVLTSVQTERAGLAMDLYSGVGLFSAFLAPSFEQVIAVEASEPACADFVENLADFENVALYVGAAEDVLPLLDASPDLVLVDPPREGLDPRALESILHLKAPRLVYVSCDPATLARDLKALLAGGYALERVTPFDLFPQTYAIESISLLHFHG